jgi:hypothetical protein
MGFIYICQLLNGRSQTNHSCININFKNVIRWLKSIGYDGIHSIYVAKQLDREIRDHYQLTVVATDHGVERRSSAVNVTVNILDNNDNKPLFVNTTYTMYIKENSPAQK